MKEICRNTKYIFDYYLLFPGLKKINSFEVLKMLKETYTQRKF